MQVPKDVPPLRCPPPSLGPSLLRLASLLCLPVGDSPSLFWQRLDQVSRSLVCGFYRAARPFLESRPAEWFTRNHAILQSFKNCNKAYERKTPWLLFYPLPRKRTLKEGTQEPTNVDAASYPSKTEGPQPWFTLMKYGFPNSALSGFFQLSPKPTGTLRAASLSRAAALFLWMRTSCSGLSGEEGGVPGSSCTARAFLGGLACKWSPHRRVTVCSGPRPGAHSCRPQPHGPWRSTPIRGPAAPTGQVVAKPDSGGPVREGRPLPPVLSLAPRGGGERGGEERPRCLPRGWREGRP